MPRLLESSLIILLVILEGQMPIQYTIIEHLRSNTIYLYGLPGDGIFIRKLELPLNLISLGALSMAHFLAVVRDL